MVRGARGCERIASCGARPNGGARDLREPAARLPGERRVHPHPSCSCALQRDGNQPTSRRATGFQLAEEHATMDYIGGFQIGYRLQRTGVNGNFQTAALSMNGGSRRAAHTAPSNSPPYCVGKNGTGGRDHAGWERDPVRGGRDLLVLGVDSRRHDRHRLRGRGWRPRATDRSPSTSTWRRSWPATRSRSARNRYPGDPFVGIRAADPPGGYGDRRCAPGRHGQP